MKDNKDSKDAAISEGCVSDALACGLLSKTKRSAPASEPGPLLKKADGLDIVKKASTRKGRALLLFSCKMTPIQGGMLGDLAQLDSQVPVLYMGFTMGRLKFQGTLVFPKNRYMALKLGSASNVLCEDVFEHIIVFSPPIWIGTKEQNPDEKELPMPAFIANAVDDGAISFTQGLAATNGALAGDEGIAARKAACKPGAKRRRAALRGSASEDEPSSGEEGGEQETRPEGSARSRPRRASAQAALRLDLSDSQQEEDEAEEKAAASPSSSGGTAAAAARPLSTPKKKKQRRHAAAAGSASPITATPPLMQPLQASTSRASGKAAAGSKPTPPKRRKGGKESASAEAEEMTALGEAGTGLCTGSPARRVSLGRAARAGVVYGRSRSQGDGSDDAGHSSDSSAPESISSDDE